MNRRSFLAACAAGLGAGTAGCVSLPDRPLDATVGTPMPRGETVALDPVVEGSPPGEGGLSFPVDMAVLPDGRWYVVQRTGKVFLTGPDIEPRPVLDLTERVPTEREQGMVAIALHPEFASNDRLFLRYSAPPRPGTPANYTHTAVLAEFRASADRTSIDVESERAVLEMPEPAKTHNGGGLAWGPEDNLFVSTGDGQWLEYPPTNVEVKHADDWYDWNEGGNGQNITDNLLGSVLRIDVDSREDGKGYGIPDDNPLVGSAGRDEQWAWGFRNPWKLGFSDGTLIVSDVGEASYEEIDVVVKGGNYGWSVKEGRTCFNGKRAKLPGPWCPDESPRGEELRDPVVQYPHQVRANGEVRTAGVAVVGGYVQQGDGPLAGEYIFGDYIGRLFAATPEGDRWPHRALGVQGSESGRLPGLLLGFHQTEDGDLYALVSGGTGLIARVSGVSG